VILPGNLESPVRVLRTTATIHWITEPKHVREVSLIGTSDFRFSVRTDTTHGKSKTYRRTDVFPHDHAVQPCAEAGGGVDFKLGHHPPDTALAARFLRLLQSPAYGAPARLS